MILSKRWNQSCNVRAVLAEPEGPYTIQGVHGHSGAGRASKEKWSIPSKEAGRSQLRGRNQKVIDIWVTYTTTSIQDVGDNWRCTSQEVTGPSRHVHPLPECVALSTMVWEECNDVMTEGMMCAAQLESIKAPVCIARGRLGIYIFVYTKTTWKNELYTDLKLPWRFHVLPWVDPVCGWLAG